MRLNGCIKIHAKKEHFIEYLLHRVCVLLLIAENGEKESGGSDKGTSPGEMVAKKGSWARVVQRSVRVARWTEH